MFLKKQRPAAIIAFIFIALVSAIVFHPWTDKYNDGLITWDKLGYYLYLPNLFIYNDWHLFEFAKNVFETYQPSATWYQTLRLDNGNYFITYPTGVAYFQLPFFLVAHLYASVFDYPADGFSTPYVFAVYASAVFYVILGLYLTFKTLQRFFSFNQSLLIIFILMLSTNLYYYGFVDNIMPHSYSFFLFSVLLYYTIRWHESPGFRHLLIVCLSLGFIISIRLTDAIAIIIPILYGVYDINSLRNKFSLAREHFKSILIAGFIGLIPFVIQMCYWKFATGQWLFNAYTFTNLGFNWHAPETGNFLYSFRKGWLIYTPVMILSIIGIFRMYSRQYKSLMAGIVIFILIDIYVLSSWQVWWFGGSFGQRSMVQAYAFLAIPLGCGIALFQNIRLLRIGLILFLSACTLLNLLHTWQYKNSLILVDNITRSMFKESILHPFHYYIPESKRVEKMQWKDDYVLSKKTITDIDKVHVLTKGGFLDILDIKGAEVKTFPFQWIRCTFESRYTADHLLTSENLQVVNEVKNNDLMRYLKIKTFTDRFAEIYAWSEWTPGMVDFRIPTNLKDDDRFMIYFFLPDNPEAGIRNIRLSGLEIKE